MQDHCNGIQDCVDGLDELRCKRREDANLTLANTLPPPALVEFDGTGMFTVRPLSNVYNNGSSCPETHFQCPPNGYCVPVYVRCNGVNDCPEGEDEECDEYTCPGLYRCRGISWCLHPDYMCDGLYHCPQQDDEVFCDLNCEPSCRCHGLAFVCAHVFAAEMYTQLRYLDAKGSKMTAVDVSKNNMLIHLSLAACQLHHLGQLMLPNLRSLDISDNILHTIRVTELHELVNLQVLFLTGNKLTSLFPDSTGSVPSLEVLDLSLVQMPELDVQVLSSFPNLQLLNLSQCGLQTVSSVGFQPLAHIRVLDLRGCPLRWFPRDIFRGLSQLDDVDADNYKVCCQITLPEGFNTLKCRAPYNHLSSCEALLRSTIYRFCLSVFAVFALTGNAVSFVIRVIVQRTSNKSGFGVFVTNLAIADFFMGLYLAVIGVTDRLYQGTYLWEEYNWRHSPMCKMAGFVSLISSEMSAFIICMITLDRFLVTRFPFSKVRFGVPSAQLACMTLWVASFVLATIPLLPITSYWQFYEQTGICIPLPLSITDFAGHDYSFGVIVALNFVLFLLIAAGQASVYASIQANRMASAESSSRQSQDLSIARRLLTIAVSDFLCWFPIGLLGLLSASGHPIPGEVSVVMAIVVLPLNSALNPFLYTLNTILERRRRIREERLLQILQSQSAVKRM